MINEPKNCEECKRELQKCLKCGQKIENYAPDKDKRGWIAFWFCFSFIILSSLLIQCNWNSVLSIFYKWEIISRILFCFDLFLLGVGIRAWVWNYNVREGNIILKKPNPWKEYLFQYALVIGPVVSIFIFSVTTIAIVTQPNIPTYIFYFLSGSVSVVAGFKGYMFLDNIKQ